MTAQGLDTVVLDGTLLDAVPVHARTRQATCRQVRAEPGTRTGTRTGSTP